MPDLDPIWFGELWGSIISDYTKTKLTYDSDILQALSGVSESMQAFKSGRFLAGLWGVDLHFQLGWRSLRPSEYMLWSGAKPRRTKHYTAPTFSWASRLGRVFFPLSEIITSTSAVLDSHCEVAERNPFGKVLGGYLKLSGKLLIGNVVQADEYRHEWFFIPEERSFDRNGSATPDSFAWLRSSPKCHTSCPRPFSTVGRISLDETDEIAAMANKTVHCFEIFQSYTRSEHHQPCIHSTALVLRQSLTDKAEFQRFGLAEPLPPHWFDRVPSTEITIV